MARPARFFGFLSVTVIAAGCQTTVPMESIRALPADAGWTLQISEADSSSVRLTDAALSGDTLLGRIHGRPAAIPLADVEAARRVVISPVRTATVAAGVGGAMLLLMLKHPWNDDQQGCAGVGRLGPNGELSSTC